MNKVKSIFYTLIIVFLCIVDQRRGSAPGQVQFVFVNLSGVAVCLLMFTAYRLKEFCKLPYWLWTIAYGLGAVLVTYIRGELILYPGQWYTALLNIWLMGLILIKIIIRFIVEKWRPKFSYKALVFFLGFMLLACLLRNDSLWTWWYLFLFGMLYLTDFSSEDKRRLLDAISNGIIISFFVIQGMAFVFRPYDFLRYMGLYANPNMNALFYSLVYSAFLGKYCMYFGRDKEIKYCRIIRILILLFCGAMWSFVCFTMCRTAMVSMFFATACAGIYCLCKAGERIIRTAVGMLAGLIVSIVICAPITYCAVRYLPPLFHHPIWFGAEYSPGRVHSWDPIDSPKYISWEQVLDGLFGRWKDVEVSELISKNESTPVLGMALVKYDIMVANLAQNQVALLSDDSASGVTVRTSIFKYYFEHLNISGHTNAEDGFQLTKKYWVPHAHNIFLQMAFSFGIPSAIFFVTWLGYVMFIAGKKAFGDNKDARMATMLLFYINIIVFGMLEIVWLTGQLSFALLFLMPLVICDENKRAINKRVWRKE